MAEAGYTIKKKKKEKKNQTQFLALSLARRSKTEQPLLVVLFMQLYLHGLIKARNVLLLAGDIYKLIARRDSPSELHILTRRFR